MSVANLTHRVAIVGTGDIARAHAAGYQAAGAEIVAICDINPNMLARRQREWEVDSTYTDYRELIGGASFDAISICTPNSTHHPIALAAAAAKRHVLCEKPVSLDLAQGEEMIAATHEAGVVFQVGHHLRSWAAAAKAKAIIDSGDLGRVTAIRFRQAHDWGGSGVRGVFGSKALSGGGTLLDNGCHLFDLARYFGGDVASVFARIARLQYEIEVEDTAHASLQFTSGALATIETAWTATGYHEGFWVFGTKGSLECDSRTGANTLIHRYRSVGSAPGNTTDVVTHSLNAPVAHTTHVGNFLAAIDGTREVICTGRDGLEAVRLVLGAYASAESGRPVELAE
jgi:predicted dehydrogenase